MPSENIANEPEPMRAGVLNDAEMTLAELMVVMLIVPSVPATTSIVTGKCDGSDVTLYLFANSMQTIQWGGPYRE